MTIIFVDTGGRLGLRFRWMMKGERNTMPINPKVSVDAAAKELVSELITKSGSQWSLHKILLRLDWDVDYRMIEKWRTGLRFMSVNDFDRMRELKPRILELIREHR